MLVRLGQEVQALPPQGRSGVALTTLRRIAIALVALAGCTAEESAVEAGNPVAMDFRSDDFFAAPFPSEHRRGGALAAGFPRQEPPIPFVSNLLALAEDMDGFGTTSGIFFRVPGGVGPAVDADPTQSATDAPIRLFELGSPGRLPVDVRFDAWAGPYGGPDLLSILPLQGAPMAPDSMHAAVVLRTLGDPDGDSLGPVDWGALLDGDAPWTDAYRGALGTLERDHGVAPDEIAGLAVFRTQDPTAEQHRLVTTIRREGAALIANPVLETVYPEFCVFRGELEVPVFQAGEPPFLTGGGTLAWDGDGAVVQRTEFSRLYVTVPRGVPMPPAGWPTAVFVRTGGGGDLPLMERGVRDASGDVLEPGTGPALQLAREGWAGVQIDGPHGGPRNVDGGDEQFLMFNVTNPGAARDNVRQSAGELTLLPDLLPDLSIDPTGCPDLDAPRFDGDHLALIGHSMGATIAPLVLATEPRFAAAVLSGAGGSWVHNIVHKQSPLETRPLAEAVLGYDVQGFALTEHDVVLSLLQWVGESGDPPVYADGMRRASEGGAPRDVGGLPHVLMVQGIVDTYILPPIANALSASLSLAVQEPALDETYPWDADYETAAITNARAGRTGPPEGVVGVLRQVAEDGVEDGHEVFFQQDEPKEYLRCFLRSVADDAPAAPRPGCLDR